MQQVGIFWILGNEIHFKSQNIKGIEPIFGFIDDSDLGSYEEWQEFMN